MSTQAQLTQNLVFFAFLAVLLIHSSTTGGTFTVFGPETFARSTAAPVAITRTFSVRNPSVEYRMLIQNGGSAEKEFKRLSSVIITLNGTEIVGTQELNQTVTHIEKQVSLLSQNELSVEGRSNSGGAITIEILGIDDDPPTITVSVSPPPNTNGWHHTAATASFLCDDLTSGIASCPDPAVVSMEGADQEICGTAIDLAGNASIPACTTVNLDKTPPMLAIDTPNPGAVVDTADIMVHGTVSDLSPVQVFVNDQAATLLDGGTRWMRDVHLAEGNNSIVVTARDAAGNESLPITVNVTFQPGPTRTSIRGVILSAQSETPIENVLVAIGEKADRSDVIGAFLIENPPLGLQRIHLDAREALGGRFSSFNSVMNVLPGETVVDRPFYLPELDMSQAVLYQGDPIEVMNDAIPGARLTIPQNSLIFPDGSTEGLVVLAEVPKDKTPRNLPRDLDPSLIITVQPEGARLTRPAGLLLPNRENLPIGNKMMLWSLNPATGRFRQMGFATVTPDGIKTEPGVGLTAFDWHFFLPPTPGSDSQAASNRSRKNCAECELSGQGAIGEGTLFMEHETPTYRSLGAERNLRLVYSSDRAAPMPILPVDVTISERSAVPRSLSYRLTLDGTPVTPELHIDTSAFSEETDTTFRLASSFDAADLDTSVYSTDLALTNHFPQSAVTGHLNESIPIVNSRTSPFGAGWGLAGLQRLHILDEGRILLEDGDGSSLVFEEGDFKLSLEQGGTLIDDIRPISGARSVEEFYGYDVGAPKSSNTALERRLESLIFFYRDTQTDELSLVFIHDAPDGLTGGQAIFTLTGWPQHAFLAVEDDPSSDLSDGYNIRPPLAILAWNWMRFHTDGGAIGGLNAPFAITLFPNFTNIGTWNLVHGDGRVHPLSSIIDPIILRREAGPEASDIYQSPLGDFSTLRREADGSFTRTLSTGVVTRFDPDGRQNARIDRNGNTTDYDYDAEGHLKTIVDPVGRATAFRYTNGQLSEIEDPVGRITSLQHDTLGNLTTIVNPDGSIRHFGYDGNHLLTSDTSPVGAPTSYAYDAHRRLLRVTHPDGSTRIITPQVEQGLPGTTLGSGTEADPFAPLFPDAAFGTLRDGNGQATHIRTNSFGSLVSYRDAIGHETVIERTRENLPSALRRPDGTTVSMTYDRKGNLLELMNGATAATTTFVYDERFNQVSAIADPEDNTTTIVYDGKGNPIVLTDAAGSQTALSYDASGLLTALADSLGEMTQFSYDVNGNLVATTNSLGHTTSITSDGAGNVASVTDALGNVTAYAYDSMNRLTEVAEPGGSTTQYAYDAVGQLTQVTDVRGQSVRYAYNNEGDLTSIINPLGFNRTFSYDPDGNLVRITNTRGQAMTFQYDLAGRLVKKILPDDAVTFSYDSAGRVASIIDNDSQLAFQYDSAGRVSNQTSTVGTSNAMVSINYQYDNNGNRIAMTDPTGTTSYTYDSLNRLTTLEDPDSRTASFEYDALSRRTRRLLANGPTTTYVYDSASQLTRLGHELNGMMLQSFAINYDARGNLRERTTLRGTSSYTHDALNRLLSASHTDPVTPNERFAYDAVGHRLSDATRVYLYDAVGRLTGDTLFDYGYDADGNLIGKVEKATGTIWNYDWDVENRLMGVERRDGGGARVMSATYVYDGLGRRIEKVLNGQATRYVHDFEDILLEYDGLNNVTARFTHGPGIDEPLIMERNGEPFFYLADHLGSVTALLDGSGTAVKTYTYSSFGEIVDRQGTVENPFTFTGREFDDETGLMYHRARYYDPAIGRFISADQFPGLLSFPQSQTDYVYVHNNPLRFVDGNGEFATITLAGALTLGGGLLNALIDGGTAAWQGGSWTEIAVATGQGFVAGSIGTLTGIGLTFATGNPFLVGSGVALSANLTNQLLANNFNFRCLSAQDASASVLIGGLTGPLAQRVPGLRTRGRLPKLFKPRQAKDFGPNSQRLLGQEIFGGLVGESLIRLF